MEVDGFVTLQRSGKRIKEKCARSAHHQEIALPPSAFVRRPAGATSQGDQGQACRIERLSRTGLGLWREATDNATTVVQEFDPRRTDGIDDKSRATPTFAIHEDDGSITVVAPADEHSWRELWDSVGRAQYALSGRILRRTIRHFPERVDFTRGHLNWRAAALSHFETHGPISVPTVARGGLENMTGLASDFRVG